MKNIWTKFLNIYTVFMLTAVTFSCTPKQDPLKVIKFGQDSIWYAKDIISEIDDSWILKKYSHFVWDNYDNQIVSKIGIPLSSDSCYRDLEGVSRLVRIQLDPQPLSAIQSLWEKHNGTKKSIGVGPLPASTIDSLWDLYHKWYGTPDFIYEIVDTIIIQKDN